MSNSPVKRYALVRGNDSWLNEDVVARYLPDNYRVVCARDEQPYSATSRVVNTVILIEGRDDHGWTLNDYVIPRLASGNMSCEEIDLSHPIMKTVEV